MFHVQEIHQHCIKSINLKQRTHTKFAENWHFMNKCMKLCNISSYPHLDYVVYSFTDCCLLAARAAAVSRTVPPLPPHRGGRWLDSLSTRAYNECFPKVCEDFTITEKAPSRGLLRDYKPLDGPFSSSTGYFE